MWVWQDYSTDCAVNSLYFLCFRSLAVNDLVSGAAGNHHPACYVHLFTAQALCSGW
jgi:hypothetical protein